MRNIYLLTKNYFNSFIGGFRKNKSPKKYIVGISIIALVSIFMLCFFMFNSYMITKEFINVEPKYQYANFALLYDIITIFMIGCLMIIMRCASIKNTTDQNILLSLPIKKHEIIIAKSLSSYFFDLVTLLGFCLPGFIIFYILVPNISCMLIFRAVFIIIVTPLFTNGVAVIIGYLIDKFSNSFRLVSFIQTGLMICLIIVFLVINFKINDILTKQSSMSIDDTLNNYYPIKIIYEFILNNQFVPVLIFTIISIILYIFATICNINLLVNERASNNNIHKEINYNESTVFKNILKKEATRFFSIPMYILNISMGFVLTICAAIYILLKGREFLDLVVLQFTNLDSSHTPFLIILLTGAMLSTICTTYCSISLEGKSFWILKSSPIKEKTIFDAKIAFNLIIGGIAILISAIIICIVIGFEYFIYLLIFSLFLVFFNATFGLLLNLIYPKLDWVNEVVPIKQSMSVLIVMAFAFIIPFIFLVIYLLLTPFLNKFIIIIITCITLLILDLMIYKILLSKGKKLFNEII